MCQQVPFPTPPRAPCRPFWTLRSSNGLPGVTATVLVADGGAWSGAAGTADGVNPMQVRSQFAIASLTKTVIAAEIMWLSEQGLLHLSDPVSEHLPPSFHFDTNGATIENLLPMESGIPDPVLSESAPAVLADPLRYWTAEEVLASVPADRNKPGDHFVYEDANYMLLGSRYQGDNRDECVGCTPVSHSG